MRGFPRFEAKYEGYDESEEIDPSAEGNQNGIEEARRQRMWRKGGDWGLCRWSAPRFISTICYSGVLSIDQVTRMKLSGRLVQSISRGRRLVLAALMRLEIEASSATQKLHNRRAQSMINGKKASLIWQEKTFLWHFTTSFT